MDNDNINSIEATEDNQKANIMVVSQNGMSNTKNTPEKIINMVEKPAKIMRISSMIKQLLEEIRFAPLDEISRIKLKKLYKTAINELKSGLNTELIEELDKLLLPFTDDNNAPSESELRISKAQLVGWLEGLFQGIQTALVAQQLTAKYNLENISKGIPSLGQPSDDKNKKNKHDNDNGQYI